MPYTYLVRCKDSSLYAGWTMDLEQRVLSHNKGTGAKYTRGRGPVELVWWQEFSEKGTAMAKEVAIKKLSKAAKEELINGFAKEKRDSNG